MENTILIDNKLYNSEYLIRTKEGQKILKNANIEKQATRKNNVFCTCNGEKNPIPMYTRKIQYSEEYTLARNPNTMHLHNPECIRYLDSIIEDEEINKDKARTPITKDKVDGEVWKETYIFLNNYIVNLNNEKEDNKGETNKQNRAKKRSVYSMLYTILEKVTTFAWYRYVTDINNSYNPKEGNLFYYIYNDLKGLKVLHSNIENTEKLSKVDLNKLLFKPYYKSKNEDITNQLLSERRILINNKLEKTRTIIIGKYLEHEILEDDRLKIKVLDPYLKNYYYIYGTKSIILSKLKKIIPGTSLYIIAYILPINNEAAIETFDSMLVIDDRGIYVESSYEVQFSEELFKKNILFFRPPHSETLFSHIFDTYIPDFILLDRKTRKFATIAEVFGYKRDNNNPISKVYWDNVDKKKEHYLTLREKYNLYYWDAAEGQVLDIWEPKLKK